MFAAGNGDQFAVAAIHRIAEDGEFAALVLHSRQAVHAMSAEMHGSDQHALPGREAADIFADLNDLSGHIAAQNVREFHPGQSFAHPDIQMIE